MLIELKTKTKSIPIEIDETPARCGWCWKEIFRWKTEAGKTMPVSMQDGEYISHFADCPVAQKFRKK